MSEQKRLRPKGKLSESEERELKDLGLKSFVHEYGRLQRMAGNADAGSSEVAMALTRAQLSATIRAIGIMDRAFEDSGGRNAYGYVAVHGLARELAHDLRSFGDQSETVEKLRMDVVQPMLSGLATIVISKILRYRQKLSAKLPPKSGRHVSAVLRDMQEELAADFATAESTAAERLRSALKV